MWRETSLVVAREVLYALFGIIFFRNSRKLPLKELNAVREQTGIQQRLQAIRSRHLFRQLTPLTHGAAPRIEFNQSTLLNLSSNNYLGLADHPKLKAAATEAIHTSGCGSGASRLITGTTPLHTQVEQRLAAFKKSERALLFTSGYHANMGVITSLVGRGDVVFSDELNHASIIDGCRLSGAERQIYPHNNIAVLAQQMERVGHEGVRLVVTESVFSMDGDLAPLAEIADLCRRHDALLVVDEAHATGCLGPGGRGLVAQLGLEDVVTASISTLSKAFGTIGAFVTCSSLVQELLINVARSFIFTTALPPADLAASLAALDILEADPDLPARLQRQAAFFRRGLQQLGFQTMASETHIIPLLIGNEEGAMRMAEALREHGLYAVAIRPPTVPPGAARIRFSVMASHTCEDLSFALDVVKQVGRAMGLIG
jgi:8-amino-7-oxononanoate synthase